MNNGKTPAISVVMPVYNSALYLRECMDSILSQSFRDFELIVVDDGSTDNSVDIIQSYIDPRIQLVVNEHDYIKTLNDGINMAKGKYIARMDADDIMHIKRLEVEYHFMEKNTQIDICGSFVQFFGNGNYAPIIPTGHDDIVSTLIQYGILSHPTIIMRRRKIEDMYLSVGTHELYNPDYKYAEDYYLWIDMAIKGFRFANIPQILVYQRLSDKQITSVHEKEMRRLGDKAKIVMAEFIEHTIMDSDTEQLKTKYEQSRDMLANKFISSTTFYKVISDFYRCYLKMIN